MDESTPARRYEKVDFFFPGSGSESHLPGTVIVRPDEMVLTIPGGSGPYHIVGKAKGTIYFGENSDADRRFDVRAKWTEIDGTFVGQWIEQSNVYLFSFELRLPI